MRGLFLRRLQHSAWQTDVCDSDGLIADNPLVNVRTNYDRIYPSENTFFWTDASCTLSLKVRSDGMVSFMKLWSILSLTTTPSHMWIAKIP